MHTFNIDVRDLSMSVRKIWFPRLTYTITIVLLYSIFRSSSHYNIVKVYNQNEHVYISLSFFNSKITVIVH